MKISAVLFRVRYWLLAPIAVLGFWSPWERVGGAHPGTTWLFLAGALARYRVLPIAYSSTAVMGLAILLAILAAMLRTWVAAWQERDSTRDAPYLGIYLGLYLGLWLNMLALAILMPPGGALFAVVAVTAGIAVLVRAEKLGFSETRAEPRSVAGRERPRWGQALLREIYFWGVAITYIAFASRYNVTVLEQGVLISVGAAVVVQGLLHRPPAHVAS